MVSRGELLKGDSKTAFKELWKSWGINVVRTDGGSGVTPPYNRGKLYDHIKLGDEDLKERGIERPSYRNLAIDSLKHFKRTDGVETEKYIDSGKVKALTDYIGSGVVEDSVPLVYDPEVLTILQDSAPFAYGSLPREGQEGFTAVFNVLDDRDEPIGKVDEDGAVDLQADSQGFGLTREKVDMTIYADSVALSDFSAEASSHYMNLQDLAIGARMAQHALFHEREVFYGWNVTEDDLNGSNDISSDLENYQTGPYAFDGLATWYTKRGQYSDESGTSFSDTSEILENLRGHVSDVLQNEYAVNPNDLEIWTSHTMYTELEKALIDIARVDVEGVLDYGNYTLSIKGIPVNATWNIRGAEVGDDSKDDEDLWTAGFDEEFDASATTADDDYDHSTLGSERDVFIVDTQTARFRELAPLTSFPLARRGASDEIGMVEYGSLIERSRGYFGKYIHDYNTV